MGLFDKFKKVKNTQEKQPEKQQREWKYGKNVVRMESSYDRMDNYYDAAYENFLFLYKKKPEEITEENEIQIQRMAANHIGFFMTWIIQHHFEGEIHEDELEALEKVRKEEMLGVDFFLDYCDGKLWISDFSNEILPFVGAYYEQYIHEYNVWVVNDLCDLPLEFVGTWEDYHRFEHIIDEAYADYKENVG